MTDPRTVLTFPLDGDLRGACVVLRAAPRGMRLVRCTEWVGRGRPALNERDLARTPKCAKPFPLIGRAPLVAWLEGAAPAEFEVAGSLPPSTEEARQESNLHLPEWSALAREARQALVSGTERAIAVREDTASASQSDHSSSAPSVEALVGCLPTARWEEVPAATRRRVDRALRETAEAMDAATGATEQVDALKAGVEHLNALNRDKPFIHTPEREDLCEWFLALQQAVGLSQDDLSFEWREW